MFHPTTFSGESLLAVRDIERERGTNELPSKNITLIRFTSPGLTLILTFSVTHNHLYPGSSPQHPVQTGIPGQLRVRNNLQCHLVVSVHMSFRFP